MASATHNLSNYDPNTVPNAADMRIGLVVSEYHPSTTLRLRDGAIETILEHGGKEENLQVVYVPGGYELVSGAAILGDKLTDLDAIICLGCVIKGDTDHDVYINSAVANGLADLNIKLNKPVIFGLLTVNDEQQAADRAGGKYGNKGIECAITAIKMVALQRSLS